MLMSLGHEVVAPWAYSEDEENQDDRAAYAWRMAALDLDELATCDVYVEDRTLGDSRHGSMSFECGWANGRGIPCVIIGPGRGVFDYASGVTLVADYLALNVALQNLTPR